MNGESTDGDTIAQVAVVVLLLALSVPALATAHTYAGTPIAYEQDATVDYNNTTEVSQSATDAERYGDTIRIGGVDKDLVEGEDYEWNESSGVVTWLNGPNSNNGDNATINYRAYQRTEETAAAWLVLTPLMSLFGIYGLASSARALIQYSGEVFDA